MFVLPKVELIEQGPGKEGMLKHIELAGRTAYKSEDKITEGSAKKFVDMLLARGHLSPLEHGTVYYKVPDRYDGSDLRDIIKWMHGNPYSWLSPIPFDESSWYFVTNYRVLIENPWIADKLERYGTQCDWEPLFMQRMTLRITCNRGISHELVRHRKFSFTQESTRYVSSSSKKPIIEYNCDDITDICTAYQQGFSMKNIANNSSLSEWEIRKILLEHNISIRGLNNKGNRVEDYFSVIDTPEKAYLLGLIQTDGSISITNRNATVTITQHKDYAWYIEDMLLNFSDYICNTEDKNCRQLYLESKAIVQDLIKIGIVPNKTRKQTDEDVHKLWESVPLELKGDFIRGCIDGDGYVWFFTQDKAINESCNIGLCSVKELLIDKIIDFIGDKFNYKCGKSKDRSVYKLHITDRKKAIEIGEYLYAHFKYPFGHPKKASAWIKRIGKTYPVADYKDPKFQVITPSWINNSSPESIYSYIKAIDTCENSYRQLRLLGWRPEQAREVLPNALKTEIVMTGFLDDWVDFVKKRSEHVHPEMKVIVDQIREYVNIQRSKYFAKEREEYKKTWEKFEKTMKNYTSNLEEIKVIKDDNKEGLLENDGGTGQNNS